jgi:hypothetical protein
METNGHPIGSFESYLAQRLMHLESSGLPKEALQGLRARGGEITKALITFRATRQTLTESAKYSPSGLVDELRAAAATAAGEIRGHADATGLKDNIRQHREKLTQRTTADATTELLNFWKRMELRATFERLNLTLIDPATGTLTLDTAKGNMLYRQAQERGDWLACEALEEWPTGAMVDPELVAHAQAQRLSTRDPILAQKLVELTDLHEAMEQTLKDALLELHDYLPQRDEIAERAGPAPIQTESNS